MQAQALALAPSHAAARARARRVPQVAPPQHRPAQPRLKLGNRTDAAERQADRMADRALAHEPPASSIQAPPVNAAAPPLPPGDDAGRGLESRVLRALRFGRPLPTRERTDMEARFGTSFAGVQIHTDAQAGAAAAALNAHAFALGEHVAFAEGAYRPECTGGRHLLAHELAHVVQARETRAGAEPALRRDADDDPGFFEGLFNAAGEFLAERGWSLVRRYAPRLEPILRRGPVDWLRDQLVGAFDGIVGTINRLDPSGTLDQLAGVFAGLVERAGTIVAALASGNCQPLFDAITQLKTFVTEVAGAAWERLAEFLQPVGDFFGNLWSSYGAPAVQWLQEFAGDLWTGIQQLGRDIWDWTQPIRQAAAAAWDWVKDLLFGQEDSTEGDGSEGLVGWVVRKATEAWDWVKEQTRPVWQPVADAAQMVAELIPPPFLRDLGTQMQQLSGDLQQTAGQMEEGAAGRPIAENRAALAAALPSVQQNIARVRGVLVSAGQWLLDKLSALGSGVASFMGRLRASSLLNLLAGALGWLESAAQRLLGWATGQVLGLFNWLVQGFDSLTPFFENVLGTVRRVIEVMGDLLRLPQLVLSTVWGLIPECIREPVKNFLVQQILGRIPVFGQLFTNPDLWTRVQQTALEILRQVFVDGDIPRAAWTFFQAMLRILGLPPELMVRILAKAAQAIGDVLADPLGFLANLLRAMRAGFGLFFDNVGTHLLNGVAGWLFGHLSAAGIRPPADFSLRSVLGFVLEVLGVTVDNVFRRLALRVGDPVVQRLRRMLDVASGVWSFVSILVTEGPAGLWREIQERLSNLWDRVVEGVIGWITDRVIVRATQWLLSLLDVTGIMPVINTLIAVYNAIESFVQYLREILEMVSRVLDGVIGIARGQIDEAAGFLERAMADSLPVAIGFLANQFGLGNIAQRIQELIAPVRERIDAAIDWLIDRAIRLGQALLDMARRGVAAVRGAAASLRDWWRERFGFRGADGRSHQLYFRGDGRNAQLIVESDPEPFRDFVRRQPDGPDKTEALRLYDLLRQKQDQAVAAGAASGGATHSPRSGAAASGTDLNAEINTLMQDLAAVTARLMTGRSGADEPPAWGTTTASGYGTDVSVPTMGTDALAVWPNGSAPTSATEGLDDWQRLLKRRNDNTGVSSYYVRGHLLNHNIGGPGGTWQNLTPLSQETNNRGGVESMLGRFETPVKNEIGASKTVRNFHVRPNYPGVNRSAQLQQIDQELAISRGERTGGRVDATLSEARLLAIRGAVDAEQSIPRSISCSAVIETADGNRRTINEVIDNTPTLTSGSEWARYRVNP
ncbi:eCIS core domain-containing protein [Variovorax saccharolyticus]|uniref:eCIS core domain-containing protein n=1 Tax=Variovorax saccharolyticus TaxID=3053516 RepID=UPI002575F572|nr:DUF4157 domain-containing protein [Variovorax sp. J31P216]MDM0030036.1 DUF4157 domain-containing protein [Variovorax sp. J31P216]